MDGNKYNDKVHLGITAVIVATAGVLCFPQILNLEENSLGFTNSIFAVFIWLICIYMLNYALNDIDIRDIRGWRIAGVLAFLFSLAMLLGVRLDTAGSVNIKEWQFWISIPVFTCFFAIPIRRLWKAVEDREEKISSHVNTVKTFRFLEVIKKHENLTIYFIMIICWFFVLLAVYPGFFVYDAQTEYLQVALRDFSTHHPLVHVLMLGGIICAVHKVTGSYNLGIACYMIVQMFMVGGAFTYMINFLRKRKVSGGLRITAVIYYALFPVIVMYALCSTKDTIFTAALLLVIISMLKMGLEDEKFFFSKIKMSVFICSVLVMLLFRRNAVYAFIVMTPLLLIFFRKYFKKMALLITAVFVSFFLIDGTLTLVLHADNSENQEILTVPIQQLTRAYKYNRDAFEEEDIATLYEILPEEALKLYNPKLSDAVKYNFQNAAYEENKLKYAKLWIKIGLKKPLTYINAWLVNTYGLWYPDTVVDVYRGNNKFTFVYEDSSYFEYETEPPGTRESKIPWLDELYRKMSLEIAKEKIPLVSMLFSPGFMFWCYVFAFSYAVYRKKYYVLPPYLMIFLVWLTMLLGPTYLVRYALILWFALPLFIALTWEGKKFENKI
ncbi:MAG: DUF6020 family protein [Clostridiales bacterium]|nr:DUF6020 family protein [Clostridiales bacterium]